MAEYYCKRIHGDVFSVAKFIGADLPDAIYRVKYNSKSRSGWCSCPGFAYTGARADKHIALVRDWLARGEPSPCG